MPEAIKQIQVRTDKFPKKGGWLEVKEAEIRVEFDDGHLELTIKKRGKRAQARHEARRRP